MSHNERGGYFNDYMKLKITDVTLVAIDCANYALTIRSLRNCMNKCEFDRAVFLTDIYLSEDGVEVIKIERVNSKEDYSRFVIKELYKYFDTKHCLIIQHDGTILNADCWDERFKEYDVIGAKWLYPEPEPNVGNGGFSLRSHRLMSIIAKNELIDILHPCDEVIGRLYRKYLEKNYDIKFAPIDVCDSFSFELNAPVRKTFGHHAYFHKPFKEHIVLKRTAACGDVIMIEPVINFYCEKGYQVVLDTMPQFMQLFSRYKYNVTHISEMNDKIKPFKEINFDMAYENLPKRLVLRSYIEFTGEDIPLRNSKLYFPTDNDAHLIDKLILIHIDDTGMEHRNCHGVNWHMVVAYYTKLGFQVYQIGKRMKEQVAPYMNTATIETMMFMISGAKLLIGIDSSPSQIAVALGIPAVIFFGSVKPSLRYYSMENIEVIHSPCIAEADDFCYHSEVGTTGSICKYNEIIPPCTDYTEWQTIRAANKLLKLN